MTKMVRKGKVCASLAVVGLAAMMTLVAQPSKAIDGEWHLMINGTNTLDGSSCPSGLSDDMDGTDAILGTFDWYSDTLSFTYSYDGMSWSSAPATWDVTVYVFDFTTSASIPGSGTFTIHPSFGVTTYDFTCTF